MNNTTWKAEHTDDSILDSIGFQDIILMLQCNIPKERHSRAEVIKAYKELLQSRLEDAEFILEKNIDFILKKAK
jgi:hypothetical protein